MNTRNYYFYSDLDEGVQAYLHMVPQVTLFETDHGCMLKLTREIAGHTFQAESYTFQPPQCLDELEAMVNVLRSNIAHQVMEKL